MEIITEKIKVSTKGYFMNKNAKNISFFNLIIINLITYIL